MTYQDNRVQDLFDFMVEREKIRLRRAAGQERPWTNDQILHTYKFTNFNRDDDWTTRQMDKVYEPIRREVRAHYKEESPEDKEERIKQSLITCATFRYFGTAEMASEVGWMKTWDPGRVRESYDKVVSSGHRAFTGAYNISNRGLKLPKIDVVLSTLGSLWQDATPIARTIRDTHSWREAITLMRQVEGFGGTGFMAKEVVLDMMLTGAFCYTYEGVCVLRPADWNTWTPVGPGARRGATCLTISRNASPTRADIYPMSEREALSMILSIFRRRREFLPGIICDSGLSSYSASNVHPHSIQWWLCEFAKYERTRWKLGRPKGRFYPRES